MKILSPEVVLFVRFVLSRLDLAKVSTYQSQFQASATAFNGIVTPV